MPNLKSQKVKYEIKSKSYDGISVTMSVWTLFLKSELKCQISYRETK